MRESRSSAFLLSRRDSSAAFTWFDVWPTRERSSGELAQRAQYGGKLALRPSTFTRMA